MKRILKRAMAVALTAVMLLTAAPLSGFAGLELPDLADLFALKADAATESGKCGDNLTWSLDTDTGVLTISGTGDMYNWSYSSNAPWYSNRSSIKTVVIGDSVTSIGYRAFNNCTSLTSVTIPDSVTSIGILAFYNCTSLTSVTIPDSVTSIGDGAFRNCTGLTSVTIPDSVIIIDSSAFRDCTGLTSVTIPDSVTSIGDDAFYNCTDLTSVTIGNGVTSIGEMAFGYCESLTSVTIPDSVTGIGEYAFYNCTGLTSITIPDSVTSIGGSAFNNCNNIYLLVYKNSFAEQYAIDNSLNYRIISKIPDDTETLSGKVTNSFLWSIDKMTETLTLDCNGTMVSFENDVAPWIQYEEYIKHIVINDGCTNISKNAFMLCSKVESVLIPNSVTNINNYAFYGCSRLTGINIPVGVTSIGESALAYCESLTSVTIPDSVTGIGEYAFYNCTGLTSITIPDSVTSIGYGAFAYCESLTSVTISDSVTSIVNYTFYNCTGLKELTIPCSAKIYNSEDTFYNCTNIEKVTLTKGTGTMQDYGTSTYSSSSTTHYLYTPWYKSGGKIKEIVIEEGVQNIGSYAFRGCTGLPSITIPNSVTSIGNYAFYGCTGLPSITIPNSVTSIGDSAFYGCTGLPSITIPDSVARIGEATFRNCTQLTSVTIPDSVTSIGNYAFYGCTGLTSVTIPDSVTSIGICAFEDCESLTSITIPDSVASIGEATFRNCTQLTSVTIPDSVTSIGKSAFYGCTGLTSVTIPDSVTSIGDSAFDGCTGLMSISIPDSVTSFGSNVLSGCTKLTTLYIGISNIYSSEFKNYTSLKNVTIGTDVTTIGDYAFNGCTSLEEMVIPYSVKSIGTAAFTGCTNLGSLTVYSRNCTFADDATAYYTTIYGFTGSTAETYANEKGFDFVAIDDTHTHIYDNDCDSICNLCGNESSLRGHTYYSNCDADCNVCGAVRVPPHSDNDTNGICDNCGAYLSDIALSTVKDVAVSAGKTVYLKFTAPYTGRYTFYSSSSSDTYGYVCDSNKNSLASDDDSGSNNNFLITTTLTQGTVYYLGVKYYSSSNSGTIPVTINYICDHTSTHTEHKDSTCNEHGYDKSICDICGATISTTELPYKHDYVATVTDPTCTEQGYTTYTCSLCGDSYTADYTEPLNHPHKTWRVTKNPTATSTGLMTETCDLCGAKTGEMEIPMLIPNFVTGITVSPNRLALNVGETANLTAVITPDTAENKNVIWSSSDTDIATVADGVVTAKTPGVAMIIVQSEDGGYKDFCVVRVASLTPANGAVVDNENGLIYGISSNSADINSYVNTIDDTMTVECDSALLGTGSVVNIVKDDVIVDSYKIVVFGDVNGDGWYDGQDAITVSCLANGMLTREQVGEAVWMAADCNHDGVIDQLDVDLLNQAGVLLSSIDQTKPTEELLETSAEYNEYLSLIDQSATADEEPDEPEQDNGFIAKLIAFIETILKYIVTLINKIR